MPIINFEIFCYVFFRAERSAFKYNTREKFDLIWNKSGLNKLWMVIAVLLYVRKQAAHIRDNIVE